MVKVCDMVVGNNYKLKDDKVSTLESKELTQVSGMNNPDNASYKLTFSDGTKVTKAWDDKYDEHVTGGKRKTRRQRISRRIRRRKSNRRR